jgi:hypothetical protein
MEDQTQFDLSEAIHNWRGQLGEASRLSAEELEELELHLRDSVSALQKRGLSEQEAWIIAERRVGKREALKQEFAKVTSPAKVVASAKERFVAAMQIPTPTAAEILRRIMLMERDIILPAKAVAIAILFYSFYSRPWFTNVSSALEIGVGSVREMLWAYVAVNVLAASVFLAARRVPLALLQWVVFAIMLLDGVFILTITILVGGAEGLYWLFPALLVRAAFSVPRFSSQVLVSLTLMVCYLFACSIENGLVHYLNGTGFGVMNTFPAEGQPILLQFIVMLLVAACCFAAQILMQRNNSPAMPAAD